MLTETLSGKCPFCGYDKLLQRYGSLGYYQMDGCPKCGFRYGTNHHDNQVFGVQAWLDYGIYIITMEHTGDEEPVDKDGNLHAHAMYDKWYNEIHALPELEIRKMVFEWAEKQTRCDDVEGTIFDYTEEDIQKYRETNPVIFEPQKNNL